MHRLIITFIYHQVLFLFYYNIPLFEITVINFFSESHVKSNTSKINLNDYSETDFSSSIDTHRLNTELLKLQVIIKFISYYSIVFNNNIIKIILLHFKIK